MDVETHLMVENHLTQNPNDHQEIKPILKSLKALQARLGSVDSVLANAGYFSEDNVEYCEKAQATPYIAVGREPHNLPWEARLVVPAPCPQDADRVTVMAHRLRTPQGKAIYARHKSTVETAFDGGPSACDWDVKADRLLELDKPH